MENVELRFASEEDAAALAAVTEKVWRVRAIGTGMNQAFFFRALENGVRLFAGYLPSALFLDQKPGRCVEKEAHLRRLVTVMMGYATGTLAETDEVRAVDYILDFLERVDPNCRVNRFLDGNDANQRRRVSGERRAEAVAMIIVPEFCQLFKFRGHFTPHEGEFVKARYYRQKTVRTLSAFLPA